jgi:iron complex outermembrane receptor protein
MRKSQLLTCVSMILAPTAIHAQSNSQIAPAASTAEASPESTGSASPSVRTSGSAPLDGDIIVTAQKREQSLQRVPAAVTAASGELLLQVGLTDQSELGKLAPGLLVADQAGIGLSFLRGVGQTLPTPNAAPAVSFNLNGMYVPSESGFTPLYDIERVEVLPGPQGTLYGRASAGGAINFITKIPTNEYAGNFSMEAGNHSALMATGALNVPLGSDFALRVAGIGRRHSGYLSNGLDNERMWSGRATLRYASTSPFSATVTLQRHHEGGNGHSPIQYNGDLPSPLFPNPDNLYETNIPRFGQKNKFNSLFVIGDFRLDLGNDLELSYIPGYAETKRKQDFFFLAALPAELKTSVTQYTQELKLSGKNGSSDWVAGLYYLRSPDRLLEARPRLLTGQPLGLYVLKNSVTSYAGFAEYRWRPLDGLTITGGTRYSHDRFSGVNFSSFLPFSEAAPLNAPASDSRGRFDFKLGADYSVTPASIVYGTLQTGYIAAGFAQGGPLLEPSKLTSYTVGSKNRFFDNALTANLELFYYDYKNFQLQFYQADFSFGAASVPARVLGAELALGLKLGGTDNLGLSVLYQKAELRDRTNLYVRDDVLTSVAGYQLPYAPAWTINANWSHTFPLASGARIVAQANILYSSSYWQIFTHDENTQQDSYTKTDATLTYRANDDRWSIGAFVRNLENKAVMIGSSKPGGAGQPASPFLRPPRTYGLSASVRM